MRQASKNAEKSTGGGGNGSKHWSEDDLQLLIKAVNLFPAGTNSRYWLLKFILYFVFLRAAPAAYGNSQTRGSIQSCSCQPTPQPHPGEI